MQQRSQNSVGLLVKESFEELFAHNSEDIVIRNSTSAR